MRDYYKILDVSPDSSHEQIKVAYRSKAKKYHPDVSSMPQANADFQLINEAYDTLCNTEKRRQYDIRLKYRQETGKRDDSRQYRKYGYRKGPLRHDRYSSYFRQKNKKSKRVILFDNMLYYIFLFIGIIAFIFSTSDLLQDNWDKKLNGIQGLLFSIGYLVLLVCGWRLYKKSSL